MAREPDAHQQNRRSWNAVTDAHNSHKRDQAAFLKGGGSTLFDEEIDLLGDLRGKRLVHLQCNCGQDSLSLAELGADVVGVDISDRAIAFAKKLATDSGIDASFECSDVYDWFDQAVSKQRQFDVVFSSYGVIGWLSDLTGWARGIAGVLSPGGRFALLEFHPLCWSFGDGGRLVDSYFIETPIPEPEGVADYVAGSGPGLLPMGRSNGVEDFENPESAVAYQWTVAQVLQALADAGLHLETIREYPYSNGCQLFEGMRSIGGRRYAMPPGMPDMPLMLGLVARQPD